MEYGRIMERHDALVSLRQPWEPLWREAAELVMPVANGFGGAARGSDQAFTQYDSFTMNALERFDASLESGAMPRSSLWHELETGVEEIDENHENAKFFEGFNQMLWDERYAPRSRFASQAHEVRQSLGLYGTGCLLVEPATGGGIKYRAIHLSEIYIAENSDGAPDTVHRKFEMTARQAVQTFTKDTPKKIIDAMSEGKAHKKFEFIHCVGPREDYEPGDVGKNGAKFAGYYVFCDDKKVVREDSYFEQPYIVSRYFLSTREVYGRSPVTQRLPDIRMLNEIKRVMIDFANKTISPATMSNEDVSEFDLIPGAHNPGTLDENGNPMVVPFNPGGDPRVTLQLLEDVRNQVDDGFLGIYFRVLLENPNMTATQAMLLAQQQGQMTAPAIGRIQAEWLGPMIRRESGILYRQGKHPKMPDGLAEHLRRKGRPLSIRYTSPLTRAARSEEGVGILRAFESLAPIAQIDPSVYDVFDVHEAARIITETNGVPARALKSKEALAALDEAKRGQADMAQVLQAAPIAAETAKTMAEAQQIAASSPQPVVR